MRTLTPNCKSSLACESGFTLLEIIAVLVIMSILAVVAVPKFFDLQKQAKIKALESGHAEAISRVNSYFASQVLSGVNPNDISYTEDVLGPNMGDFVLSEVSIAPNSNTAIGGSVIRLRITGRTDTPVADESTIVEIPKPGLN